MFTGNKVGIGTTQPERDLHVNGDLAVNEKIYNGEDSTTKVTIGVDSVFVDIENWEYIKMRKKLPGREVLIIDSSVFVRKPWFAPPFVGLNTKNPTRLLDVNGELALLGPIVYREKPSNQFILGNSISRIKLGGDSLFTIRRASATSKLSLIHI